MIRRAFNKNWFYKKDQAGMFSANEKGTPVTLPHDAMIFEKRSEENLTGNSGGFFPSYSYSYQKEFYVESEWCGKEILLHFEGVYNLARVYVNGSYVCQNICGYSDFFADISDSLRYGEVNQIEVKAINTENASSRWYTGAGIIRPVSLLMGGEIHVAEDGVRIRTLEAAEDISSIEVEIPVKCQAKNKTAVRINTVITECETGREVSSESSLVTLLRNESVTVRQRIYIENAMLWSPETPHLYCCHTQILGEKDDTEMVYDEAEEEFGLRHIQIDPRHGFRINGKKVLLRGSCIHHDNGILGAASVYEAEFRKIQQLKEAGFNAIRMAHNPAANACLKACDHLGMLVMDEAFDCWHHSKLQEDYSRYFDMNSEYAISRMVAKDYNHPSVIMYSIGNEIQEIGTSEGARTGRHLAELCRKLDSERFVTNAINGLLTVMGEIGIIMKELQSQENSNGTVDGDVNDLMTATMNHTGAIVSHHLVGERLEESCSSLDICGYNYMTQRYRGDAEKYKNRIMVGSETYPPEIAVNWKEIKQVPAAIGDFTWTGYDYIGESGIGVAGYNTESSFFSPYPCYLANVGDLDITGFRRPISYYREIVWGLRKTPYIAVQSPEHYNDKIALTPWISDPVVASWSWEGCEGMPCRVEVYSCDDEVELFINDQSCGKKEAGEKNNDKAVFDVIYHEGNIKAVGYRKGERTEIAELYTIDKKKSLAIALEGKGKRIKPGQIFFLQIKMEDSRQVLDYGCEETVSIEVRGSGKLIGLGNADPNSTENFFDSQRNFYDGHVLAAVQALDVPGEILIRATTSGGMTAEYHVKTDFL